jgi:hypothetical protein
VTSADADRWLDNTFVPTVATAVRTALLVDNVGSRYDGTIPVAGPYSIHSLAWVVSGGTDYWNLRQVIATPTSNAAGLSDPRINADFDETAGQNTIRITCLPIWAYVPATSVTALKAALRLIVSPRDGTQLLTEYQVGAFSDEIVSYFSPLNTTIKSLRDSLEETVTSFTRAIAFEVGTITLPTEPTKPTVPEYSTNTTTGATTRHALWIAYDAAILTYRALVAAAAGTASEIAAKKSARIAVISTLQAKALTLTRDIEYASQNKQGDIELWVKTLITNLGIGLSPSNPDGLVTIDPDRLFESRFYFATYVTGWGEESAPSPVSAMLDIDQYSNATVTVSDGGIYRPLITHWRLYRSATGTSGATSFQLVTELPVATITFEDTVKGEELGEVCPSITWLMPPFRTDAAGVAKGSDPYLRGLVGMPNGVMAGFVDNFVAFCDPYHPYAWPVEYQISLKHPVVGLGVFGQSLFVGTYANPSIISGADSSSMSEQMLDDAQGCASARSIVSAANGVLYASPDGICFASLNGVEVVTAGLYAREDWQKLNPESVVAVMHESVYYFVYSGNGGGCYALDFKVKKLSRVDISATALFSDSLTDALFYASGTQVKRAFSTGRRTGVWKSSVAVLPAQAGFAWLQVDGDQSVGTPATVKWYADGVLRYTATVSSIQPVRLPAGRYLEHEIEITSAARITKVMLASSTPELQST